MKEKKVQIAGQAVLGGVMMRGASSMALAVRDENGEIRIESERLKKPSKVNKIPFVRGVVSLVKSLITGTAIMLKSAEVAVEEVDTSKNESTMGLISIVSLLLGFALAMGLFVFLPTGITQLFGIHNGMIKLLVEGLVKTAIMIGYFMLVSLIPDIKKTFMYHGAEHKTIACFEKGDELTIDNVRVCSKHHDRCGTSFVVLVIVISILVSMLFGIIATAISFNAYFDAWWVRSLIKIALLPFTAGICYELLMLFARSNFFLFVPFKWLGKQMQKITTKEPTDDMIEVAIAAHKEVQYMDANETAQPKKFPEGITLKEFKEKVRPLLAYKTIESSDVDWVLCAVLNVKRSKLRDDLKIPFGFIPRAERMLKECADGKPLQYVLGNTEFCGLLYEVDEGCLIPRMETELLCEKVLKQYTDKRVKILDLCCGSGCIGITIAKKSKHYVTCSDVSKQALKVCKRNVKLHQAYVNVVQGDMFEPFNSKFDVIVSNPPYIASAVIETLDDKVKQHEPRLALDGGEDGLKYYRIIAENAPKYLYPDGKLFLEIGYDQAKAVKKILQDNFTVQEINKDYGGNDRIVVATVK